jgi:hypothetical protein
VSEDLHLPLLYRLLDVDPEEPVRRLVQKARVTRSLLAALVLSVAERDGHRLGTGAADEVRRARGRADEYQRLAAELDEPGVRSVKGLGIARHYPQGLVRPSVDLDLIVPDEDQLWQLVARLRANRDVQEITVTVLPYAGVRHLAVCLKWPSEDPLLDPDHCVELGTLAYEGDLDTVPPRPGFPEEQVLTDLLALAEERFQRPFDVKDVLDLAVLVGGGGVDPSAAVRAAIEFRLAPELREACLLASTHLGNPIFDRLAEMLVTPAARERQQRDPGLVGEALHREVRELLGDDSAPGAPMLGGVPLPASTTEPPAKATYRNIPGGMVLNCPLGDFLLTNQQVVPEELYDSAVAIVRA